MQVMRRSSVAVRATSAIGKRLLSEPMIANILGFGDDDSQVVNALDHAASLATGGEAPVRERTGESLVLFDSGDEVTRRGRYTVPVGFRQIHRRAGYLTRPDRDEHRIRN